MTNSPTLVVLGASGDLAARLLFPALVSLEARERLEDLKIIGYARQEWTTEQFHENLRAAFDMHACDVDEKHVDKFIERIEFHGGDISIESLEGSRSLRSTDPRSSTSRFRPECSPTRRKRSRRPGSPTRPTGFAGS